MLTYLVENRWLTSVFLVVALLVGPVIGAWLYRRPTLAATALGASVLGVMAFVLHPVDRETFATCTMEWSMPTWGRVELMANMLLFVPVALCAVVAWRRPVAALISASLFSATIEAIQAAAPALGRSCSTNDWLYNTLGAVVGAAIGTISLRAARRLEPMRRPESAHSERA